MNASTNGDRSIAEVHDAAAAIRPHRPLLRDESGTVLTVAQVAAATRTAMQWLWEIGVRPGMTVAWQLPTGTDAALVMLALSRSAVRQAPMIPAYRTKELAAALDACGADILIAGDCALAPAGANAVELPPDFTRLMCTEDRDCPDLESPSEQGPPKWIYFTSASTGAPKAVAHSDRSLLAAAHGFTEHLGLGRAAEELATVAFPIAHIGGIVALVSALIGNYPVLMITRPDPQNLLELVAAHRVTVSGGAPAIYRMLLDGQLGSRSRHPVAPSLRMLVGGGAPCPLELHHQVREHLGIPVVHAYGMTESAMITVSKYTDTAEQQCESSGSPIPGLQVRIASDDEILVRGASVTPGYLDSQQWAAALAPDGWLRTGDRGRLRPDGRLVISGRLKNMIIRKGENIAPEEIEGELISHPLIDDVVVIGGPDQTRGEIVCAVVRRSADHRDITLEEMCRFLDGRGLMKQKWPEKLVIVDSYPMTGLGKVSRTELIRQLGVKP